VQLFCDQIGLFQPEEEPPLGVRDTDFVLTIVAHLKGQDEFKAVEVTKADHFDLESFTQPYIRRTSALLTGQNVFDKWMLESTTEYLMKIKAMPNAKGTFFVDFDEFLEISMEQWALVRASWLKHLSFLFQHNATLYKVQSEAQFAVEGYSIDRDSTLVQVVKDVSGLGGSRNTPRLILEAAASASRKIMQREKQFGHHQDDRPSSSAGRSLADPAFFVTSSFSGNDDAKANSSSQQTKAAGGNTNLVELIPMKRFGVVVQSLKPSLSKDQIQLLYDACREKSMMTLRRDFEKMWVELEGLYPDGNCEGEMVNIKYFYNRHTGHSQWRKPYRMKTFNNLEINIDSFIYVMLVNDIFSTSPLAPYYHLSPGDLWPNTEIFYKELEQSRTRVVAHQPSSRPHAKVTHHKKKAILHDE